MHVIAVDVGNSTIKYVLGRSDSPEPIWSVAREWRADYRGSVLPPIDSPGHWVVSSVNAARRDRLRNWAKGQGIVGSWYDISHDDIPLEFDLPAPHRVGIDRLLAATACQAWSAGRDCIVVDCGTALTIDCVRGGRTFCGGSIVAGPQAALQALSSLTDALPDLTRHQLEHPSSAIGRSTEQAMLTGAYLAQLGAILQIVSEIATELGQQPVVVASGGAIGLWKHRLPQDWIFVDNLVLTGILQLAPELLPSS